jgi:hypothetical protein
MEVALLNTLSLIVVVIGLLLVIEKGVERVGTVPVRVQSKELKRR